MKLEHLMTEVEDNTATLRNEEWATLITAAEIGAGGTATQPDPESVRRAMRRLLRQLARSTEGQEGRS